MHGSRRWLALGLCRQEVRPGLPRNCSEADSHKNLQEVRRDVRQRALLGRGRLRGRVSVRLGRERRLQDVRGAGQNVPALGRREVRQRLSGRTVHEPGRHDVCRLLRVGAVQVRWNVKGVHRRVLGRPVHGNAERRRDERVRGRGRYRGVRGSQFRKWYL